MTFLTRLTGMREFCFAIVDNGFSALHDLQEAASMQGGIKVGARWEDASQNAIFSCARALGLLDCAAVHCPVSPAHKPGAMDLKILAQASSNALCSAHGIDMEVAQKVCAGALTANSPWVGEYLALLSPEGPGALGQTINPLFTEEFVAISVVNARQLAGLCGQPIALKLGPLCTHPKAITAARCT